MIPYGGCLVTFEDFQKKSTKAHSISCFSFSCSRMLVTFMISYFALFLMKAHLQSYPCPLQINFFYNIGFLLTVAILLQIVSGLFLALHYTADIISAYSSIFFLIREVYYGWLLRYFHSSGASFVFLFAFLFCWFSIKISSKVWWADEIFIIFRPSPSKTAWKCIRRRRFLFDAAADFLLFQKHIPEPEGKRY